MDFSIYDQDISKELIQECIFKAWNDACDFFERTQAHDIPFSFKPEYLITVCIAQRLQEYLKPESSSFSILFEEKTSSVFSRSFPTIYSEPKKKLRFHYRKIPDSQERVGHFDITIYKKVLERMSNNIYRTYSVIEVKKPVTRFDGLNADRNRIKELIERKDPYLEFVNSCKYGFITFSRNLTKQLNKINHQEERIHELFDQDKKKIIKKLSINNSGIKTKGYSYFTEDPETFHWDYLYQVYIVTIDP